MHNPGTETLPFQTLFHTYFRLHGVDGPSDPSVTVSPLKGLALVDKVADAAHSTEAREALVFDGEVDRVYADVPSTLKLSYASGGLEISTLNLPDAVVWNPHKAKVRRSSSIRLTSQSDALGDMEADGWKRFVCVEPGRVNNGFEQLKPGQSWTCSQTIRKL